MRLHLLQKVLRLPQAALKRSVTGLLQLVLLINRPARLARSGFVLPTTVLLVLLLTLTAGALTYRATSRSTQVIALREQQVITNSATPAVDRAKAKLEYLFKRDDRVPGLLPSSNVLEAMMIAPGVDLDGSGPESNFGIFPRLEDVYSLPDETRLDINGDGQTDNAWMFLSDINGDGAVDDDEVVAYSILSRDSGTDPETDAEKDVRDAPDIEKARALVTRTGPISTAQLGQKCRTARAPEGGWQVVNGSKDLLQKNFQVNAFVVNRGPGSDVNRTAQTLEFQQSREAARGSKWGAWFRYDLEIFPGPEFKWNGAMHSDSNIFVHDNIKAYMVSSNYSCIYSETASEITLDIRPESGNDPAYQGEFVLGATKLNNLNRGSATPEVHIYNGDNPALSGANGLELNANNSTRDSIRARSGQTVSPSHIGVNPLTLFTEGKSEHTVTTSWERDPAWAGSLGARRILNKEERKPFVDDFFRADNRWGPKPASKNYNMVDIYDGGAGDTSVVIGKDIDSSTYTGLTDGEGLDGFWEREAIANGLRLIVGQRLELGNTFGWNLRPTLDPVTGLRGTNPDPLYPANQARGDQTTDKATLGRNSRAYAGGVNEVLQRRALRDNLAAVQSMAVYHYSTKSNLTGFTAQATFPRACVALTAHPGTAATIVNSRTFNNYGSLPNRLKTDFLEGQGTNGWEFQFPSTGVNAFDTETKFAAQIANGQPLGNALRNLAYFAGDPKGGAPSFEPVQDGVVHPQPYMSMWGDFSPLRRIFNDYLDKSVSPRDYESLSLADKATLHTAACTLGMLAYNVKGYTDAVEVARNDANAAAMGLQLWRLISPGGSASGTVGNSTSDMSSRIGTSFPNNTNNWGSLANQPVISTPNVRTRANWIDPNPSTACAVASVTDGPGFQQGCDELEYYSQFSTEDFIRAYLRGSTGTGAESLASRSARAEIMREFVVGNQVSRDRILGFRRGAAPLGFDLSASPVVDWAGNLITLPGAQYRSACDPDIFKAVAATDPDVSQIRVGLAVAFCPTTIDTKYPSLYYLFPTVAHDHDGTGSHAQPGNPTEIVTGQPSEEYITNSYIRDENKVEPALDAYIYKVTNLEDIALEPAAGDLSDWVLPVVGNQTRLAAATLPADPFRINLPNDTAGADVAFLDKGMYDGREQMAIRVLDLDIQRLTSVTNGAGDYWIPDNKEEDGEGIVFAYREDAVREDEIVRPKNSGIASADTCTVVTAATSPVRPRFALETNASCRMSANPAALQDPPLTAIKASLKPVDYAPDPDRRPYGFRFRKGADVSYGKRRTSGMTFVTDNAVYVQGDFNLHSSNGQPFTNVNNLVEEFTSLLRSNANWGPGEFYGTNVPPSGRREALLNTDTEFAVLSFDHWRPVEILADSIGILSNNFRDGSIANTFTNRTGTSSRVSYQNQNRPYFTTDLGANDWVQENDWQGTALTASGTTPTTPIWVDRNGVYERTVPQPGAILGGVAEYIPLSNQNERGSNLISAADTNVNASFVSGIVPSRAFQSYGGFHNFPRFNEAWGGDLYISGSFFQLDFSTAATGPFDQDAWEPGEDPNAIAGSDEYISYYDPPNRRWGYDVALQYVPPAPVSRRFLSYGSPRSEYYRELSVDDPYMVLLRCAPMPNGDRIDPRVLPEQCPDPA